MVWALIPEAADDEVCGSADHHSRPSPPHASVSTQLMRWLWIPKMSNTNAIYASSLGPLFEERSSSGSAGGRTFVTSMADLRHDWSSYVGDRKAFGNFEYECVAPFSSGNFNLKRDDVVLAYVVARRIAQGGEMFGVSHDRSQFFLATVVDARVRLSDNFRKIRLRLVIGREHRSATTADAEETEEMEESKRMSESVSPESESDRRAETQFSEKIASADREAHDKFDEESTRDVGHEVETEKTEGAQASEPRSSTSKSSPQSLSRVRRRGRTTQKQSHRRWSSKELEFYAPVEMILPITRAAHLPFSVSKFIIELQASCERLCHRRIPDSEFQRSKHELRLFLHRLGLLLWTLPVEDLIVEVQERLLKVEQVFEQIRARSTRHEGGASRSSVDSGGRASLEDDVRDLRNRFAALKLLLELETVSGLDLLKETGYERNERPVQASTKTVFDQCLGVLSGSFPRKLTEKGLQKVLEAAEGVVFLFEKRRKDLELARQNGGLLPDFSRSALHEKLTKFCREQDSWLNKPTSALLSQLCRSLDSNDFNLKQWKTLSDELNDNAELRGVAADVAKYVKSRESAECRLTLQRGINSLSSGREQRLFGSDEDVFANFHTGLSFDVLKKLWLENTDVVCCTKTLAPKTYTKLNSKFDKKDDKHCDILKMRRDKPTETKLKEESDRKMETAADDFKYMCHSVGLPWRTYIENFKEEADKFQTFQKTLKDLRLTNSKLVEPGMSYGKLVVRNSCREKLINLGVGGHELTDDQLYTELAKKRVADADDKTLKLLEDSSGVLRRCVEVLSPERFVDESAHLRIIASRGQPVTWMQYLFGSDEVNRIEKAFQNVCAHMEDMNVHFLSIQDPLVLFFLMTSRRLMPSFEARKTLERHCLPDDHVSKFLLTKPELNRDLSSVAASAHILCSGLEELAKTSLTSCGSGQTPNLISHVASVASSNANCNRLRQMIFDAMLQTVSTNTDYQGISILERAWQVFFESVLSDIFLRNQIDNITRERKVDKLVVVDALWYALCLGYYQDAKEVVWTDSVGWWNNFGSWAKRSKRILRDTISGMTSLLTSPFSSVLSSLRGSRQASPPSGSTPTTTPPGEATAVTASTGTQGGVDPGQLREALGRVSADREVELSKTQRLEFLSYLEETYWTGRLQNAEQAESYLRERFQRSDIYKRQGSTIPSVPICFPILLNYRHEESHS
jgi:hypothetical protein